MKNRRLVYFDFVTHFGGAQRSTVLLCDHLKEFYDVNVIDAYGFCETYLSALAERNIAHDILCADTKEVIIGYKDRPLKRIWRSVRQLPTLFKLRKRLIERILQINPDLIWTNSGKALAFLATSWRLQRYPRVIYARGWYRRSQVSWFCRWLIRHCADGVMAVSNPTSASLQSWGVPKRIIHVVFNTVDFDRVLEDSTEVTGAPIKGIAKNCKILVPGQLTRSKGQYTAIKAAALLKKKKLDFVMWLAGDIPIGNKSQYYENLLDLIRVSGLEENVFFVGWRSDVPALMRLADIVVLPTHTEGFPRALAEAMVLGRPVVSTAVGGVSDLIIHGETGLLMPVDDENALARSIERLMSDGEFARRIVAKAHKYIYDSFHTDKQIRLVREGFECAIVGKE